MKSLDQITDDDSFDAQEGEADEIRVLGEEAAAFILSQKWCKNVKSIYFDRGFSKVAVFKFELEPTSSSVDPAVWVIVGDLPPAYIDATSNTNGAMALAGYVSEMLRWVKAVKRGKSTSSLIPVVRRGSHEPVLATAEFATMLNGRLDFIRKNLLSNWRSEL